MQRQRSPRIGTVDPHRRCRGITFKGLSLSAYNLRAAEDVTSNDHRGRGDRLLILSSEFF
jgi:hypothetical protein